MNDDNTGYEDVLRRLRAYGPRLDDPQGHDASDMFIDSGRGPRRRLRIAFGAMTTAAAVALAVVVIVRPVPDKTSITATIPPGGYVIRKLPPDFGVPERMPDIRGSFGPSPVRRLWSTPDAAAGLAATAVPVDLTRGLGIPDDRHGDGEWIVSEAPDGYESILARGDIRIRLLAKGVPPHRLNTLSAGVGLTSNSVPELAEVPEGWTVDVLYDERPNPLNSESIRYISRNGVRVLSLGWRVPGSSPLIREFLDGRPGETIRVGDAEGRLSSSAGPPRQWNLSWTSGPTAYELTGTEVDRGQLIQAAESVERVDVDAWRAIREGRVQLPPVHPSPIPGPTVVSDRFGDGVGFAITESTSSSDSYCVTLKIRPEETNWCRNDRGVRWLAPVVATGADGVSRVFVEVHDERIASVRLERDRADPAKLRIHPANGRRFATTSVLSGVEPEDKLVGLSSDGTMITSADLGPTDRAFRRMEPITFHRFGRTTVVVSAAQTAVAPHRAGYCIGLNRGSLKRVSCRPASMPIRPSQDGIVHVDLIGDQLVLQVDRARNVAMLRSPSGHRVTMLTPPGTEELPFRLAFVDNVLDVSKVEIEGISRDQRVVASYRLRPE